MSLRDDAPPAKLGRVAAACRMLHAACRRSRASNVRGTPPKTHRLQLQRSIPAYQEEGIDCPAAMRGNILHVHKVSHLVGHIICVSARSKLGRADLPLLLLPLSLLPTRSILLQPQFLIPHFSAVESALATDPLSMGRECRPPSWHTRGPSMVG